MHSHPMSFICVGWRADEGISRDMYYVLDCAWVDLERLNTEPCGGSGPYTITNPLLHFDVAAQCQ